MGEEKNLEAEWRQSYNITEVPTQNPAPFLKLVTKGGNTNRSMMTTAGPRHF